MTNCTILGRRSVFVRRVWEVSGHKLNVTSRKTVANEVECVTKGVAGRLSEMQRAYARPRKKSHRATINYEIEMLRFCAERCSHRDCAKLGDLYLEGFLLHYRNLIEFFSGNHGQHGDAISMAKPAAWAGRELSPSEVTSIKRPAIRLDDEYFQQISKYLQHCTLDRSERDRSWRVGSMMGEIDPIITEFERAFPKEALDE
jgi:hypothetical protein